MRHLVHVLGLTATAVLAAWPSAAQHLWHARPRIAAVTVLPEPETEPTVRVS
jgi:hypothetical protein